jgi:hypothetical protein
MTDHKPMIHLLSEMLLQKERLEIIFSDDSGEHLGADAHFFYTLFKLKDGSLKDGFELVNDGSYSDWEARAEVVVAYAQKYAGAYDIAVKICKWHLQRNLGLPTALRLLCAEILAGNITKPNGRILGKGGDKNWMRNEIFVRYMKFLIDTCEYKPQRNPASGHNSAADILAAAFNECGYRMITYDTILNVWKDVTFREELSALWRR